jgi:L-threonylcarbamoyladenylate synthase
VRVFRAEGLQDTAYAEIVSLLNSGGIIGFPTDTAYGLGADPFNEAAVDRIFEIKGRVETKPILLIVNSIEMAESVSRPPDCFYDVTRRYWPGPLTVVVPAAASLPARLTSGTNTIGIRWPAAALAECMIRYFGKPLTATSANRTGMPSAVTVEEVQDQLGDKLDAVIDGGTLPARGGSTLLDLTLDPPVILREGPVTFESLSDFFKGRIRRHVA